MGSGRSERFGPVERSRASMAMVAGVIALVAPIAVAYPPVVPWRPLMGAALVSAAEAELAPSPSIPTPVPVPDPVPDPSADDAPRRSSLTVEACRVPDPASGSDRGELARMVWTVFRCVTAASGLDRVEPEGLDTEGHRWDGAARWGFASLADQVAAEAVVVAYCESGGFDPWVLAHDNPYGYGGVFQMGDAEWAVYGEGSKFDPVGNTWAAARYFVAARADGDPWGGWGPWAVVNTDYGGPNAGVRVPALPRFLSTDPRYRASAGPELPAWAVDPWSHDVPPWKGCPITRPGMSW